MYCTHLLALGFICRGRASINPPRWFCSSHDNTFWRTSKTFTIGNPDHQSTKVVLLIAWRGPTLFPLQWRNFGLEIEMRERESYLPYGIRPQSQWKCHNSIMSIKFADMVKFLWRERMKNVMKSWHYLVYGLGNCVDDTSTSYGTKPNRRRQYTRQEGITWKGLLLLY